MNAVKHHDVNLWFTHQRGRSFGCIYPFSTQRRVNHSQAYEESTGCMKEYNVVIDDVQQMHVQRG